MQGEQQKRWQEFCELATKDHNPKRLIELVSEMNRLFEAEHTAQRKPAQKTEQARAPIRTGTDHNERLISPQPRSGIRNRNAPTDECDGIRIKSNQRFNR